MRDATHGVGEWEVIVRMGGRAHGPYMFPGQARAARWGNLVAHRVHGRADVTKRRPVSHDARDSETRMTDETREAIDTMWLDGERAVDIADATGLTVYEVRQYCRRHLDGFSADDGPRMLPDDDEPAPAGDATHVFDPLGDRYDEAGPDPLLANRLIDQVRGDETEWL